LTNSTGLVNHSMTPHPDLVKILVNKKCKVAVKKYDAKHMQLWIRYDALTRTRPQAGLQDIWGQSQSIFDKIASTVRRYYPFAEVISQAGKDSVVYKIEIREPVKAPIVTASDTTTLDTTETDSNVKPTKRK